MIRAELSKHRGKEQRQGTVLGRCQGEKCTKTDGSGFYENGENNCAVKDGFRVEWDYTRDQF